jgi:hypothetical protein
MEAADRKPVEGTTEPSYLTSEELASAQRRQRIAQWAVPAFTGALVVVSSYAGEQQKPASVLRGMTARIGGVGARLGALAGRR